MDQRSGPKRISPLYPPLEPFAQRFLPVGEGHEIYVEECGAPEGVPVLVLHGGPGGGCSPAMRRYFDPAFYRIILFDQRGCGRSRPHAEVAANTTDHLIADIERIRAALGVDAFLLFGGSWGATLALAYAIRHPARVRGLVLRGVFLGTRAELDWFYGGGAGQFFPDLWAEFCAPIPEVERGDLIGAYHRRLFAEGEAALRLAQLWTRWENALASVQGAGGMGEAPAEFSRAFARLECHYFHNACFLPEDAWILQNRGVIESLSATIVQGRFDMICPPLAAWRLAAGWPGADLRLIGLAGHALSEPPISAALRQACDEWRQRLVG